MNDEAAAAPRPSVLVVEDEADVAMLVKTQLRRNGFDVRTESGGEAGLRAARTSRPDVLVLDLRMHPKSGFDVLDELRADPRLSAIPVLVISVLDHEDRALAAGAQAFLGKPFEPHELIERVNDLLAQGTSRR